MKNKLVIRSFIRKKSFILYVILLTMLFSGLLVLNVLLTNLENTRKVNNANNTLAILTRSQDIYDELKNIKMITDIKRVTYFEYIKDETGLYSRVSEPRVQSRVLVIEDSNLNNNQTDLYLHDSYDEISKLHYNNELLTFIFNEKEYKFNINKVKENDHINCVSVSSSIFNELRKASNEFNYIFKLYNKEEEVRKKLSDIKMLTGTTDDELVIANRINQHIRILIIFNVGVFVLFMIVIFVIAKSLIYDFNKNIALEKALGFNKNMISESIIIRLIILNSISLAGSIITSLLLLNLINLFYKVNIFLICYYLVVLLIIFIIISILYVVHKSMKMNEI